MCPPRSRRILKCAPRPLLRQLSRPAAVLVTGIPGRGGEGRGGVSDVTTDPPTGDGGVAMTTQRSTGRKPAGTFGVLLGGRADNWSGGHRWKLMGCLLCQCGFRSVPPSRDSSPKAAVRGGWLGCVYGSLRKHTGVPQMHLKVYKSIK